mmetsp:Transcript_3455/g.15192  ORF Transcript_3455/g.15192 Transcript_3455/m.15192 type:complete len:220 (+) Transcript_3455:82-741(+)
MYITTHVKTTPTRTKTIHVQHPPRLFVSYIAFCRDRSFLTPARLRSSDPSTTSSSLRLSLKLASIANEFALMPPASSSISSVSSSCAALCRAMWASPASEILTPPTRRCLAAPPTVSAATPDDDLGSGDDAEPVALLRTGAGGLYGRHSRADEDAAPAAAVTYGAARWRDDDDVDDDVDGSPSATTVDATRSTRAAYASAVAGSRARISVTSPRMTSTC